MVVYITGYMILINVVAFLIMRLDKQLAIRRKYRVPEKTLWILAAAGGATGCLAGMQMFRHKSKHFSFRMGLPALMLIQLICLYFISTMGILQVQD